MALSGHQKTAADQRSLVAASKPDLVILDTPELNAETPAHLLDDDITPLPRLFARNAGAMPAGTVVTHYGKQVHWDGAKDEDAVLLIVGIGPATNTRVEEAK